MNHQFKMVKLGEIFNIQIGKTPSRAKLDYWTNGNHDWLSISDMNQGKLLSKTKEKITDTAVKDSQIKLTPKGVVLLSYKLSIGKVGITDKPLFTNEAIASLIPFKKDIDANYTYWVLQNIDLLADSDRAVMGKTLNKEKLKNLEIPLPPLPTQTHIAHLLDKADELRQKRQTAIKKLDDLLQATFIKMFGDPVVNDKGWEIKPFKDIVINFAEQDNYKDDDEVWLLNLDMIEAQTGQVLQKQFISYKDLNTSTRHFDGTTVLYNKLRPYLNKVVMPKDDEHGYCTSELVVLQPKQVFINRYFLTYYLRSNEFVTWASQKVAGAKMPRLTMTDFWDKPVYIPPLTLQTQFATIATHIETQKAKLQAQADELETLFLALQQKAFNGEITHD